MNDPEERELAKFFRTHLDPATNREREENARLAKTVESALGTFLPKTKRQRIHRRRKSRAKKLS